MWFCRNCRFLQVTLPDRTLTRVSYTSPSTPSHPLWIAHYLMPPSPIGPASSSKPRPGYKYHVFFSLSTLHTLHPALEDGTDRGFRNVGKQKSDAVEIPKRIHTIKQLLSQNECSAHHIHSLRLKYHSAVITQVCHGLYGWSTAKWQMETGLLWQLTCSYNLVCPAVHGKKKKTAPLPPRPFLSGS